MSGQPEFVLQLKSTTKLLNTWTILSLASHHFLFSTPCQTRTGSALVFLTITWQRSKGAHRCLLALSSKLGSGGFSISLDTDKLCSSRFWIGSLGLLALGFCFSELQDLCHMCWALGFHFFVPQSSCYSKGKVGMKN